MYPSTHAATAVVRNKPLSKLFQRGISAVAILCTGLMASPVIAATVAYDMVGSASSNLNSFTNPYDGAFASASDGFQKYQRGVSSSIPYSVLDDSAGSYSGDSLGIIKTGNTDIFFGATDTDNPDNSGQVSATWEFAVSGASSLFLSIDMGAMGDFEGSDTFEWTYSIDGGPTLTAFSGVADESGSNFYTLEGGGVFPLNDPMTVQGIVLTNDLATFSQSLAGIGSTLTVTLTLETNGGTEAFAFQNLVITDSPPVASAVAYDMVGSASSNLNSFTNPYDGAFASASDGFQKYQRGVSSSIPYSVLDDSAGSYSGDSLGIIKTGNTDIFFGATDTDNPDNSGQVSATWEFAVSGASSLFLSIDMGAMGDFEGSDTFEWTYSIDGGPTLTAFSGVADESGSNFYTLEGGGVFPLNDPMTVQGIVLTNDLATFSQSLAGTGSTLTVTLTLETNGGTEAFAFQNLLVTAGNPPPLDPVDLEIFEIQGAGSSSSFDGSPVATNDNIVTVVGPEGFFMQTPSARSDANIDTSDGIYVFTGSAPAVAVGDSVDVSGQVDEFFGFTELTGSPVVVVNSSGNALPPAVVFNASVPSPNPASASCAIEFECYEGMLVSIANGTVTGGNQDFGSDPTAEVYITAAGARSYREPGLEYPGVGGAIPTWDTNPEVFEMDVDALGLASQIIVGGSSFSATGVIGFEYGDYELWPTVLSVAQPPLPIAVRARTQGEVTVGSLNLYRLFSSEDDYASRLAKFSLYIRQTLDSPDVLAVQEVSDIGTLQGLASQIALDDAGVQYVAYLIEGHDVGGIDVGFLVRSDIAVDSVTQLGADELFYYDGSDLHDRPPLLLVGRYTGNGFDFPLAVMVVHNRSLNGIETERVQLKRLEQAQSIAAKVQSFQGSNPDVPLVVLGDFNAFEFTDGYVDAVGHIMGDFYAAESLQSGTDLVSPNLTNQVELLNAAERYSFVYEGNAQALDHILTNAAATYWARGMAYGRGNADAAHDQINDAGTAMRSSDHDGLVLFLMTDFDSDGVADDVDGCPMNQYASEAHPEVGCDVSIPTLGPAGLALLFLLLSGLGVYTVRYRSASKVR